MQPSLQLTIENLGNIYVPKPLGNQLIKAALHLGGKKCRKWIFVWVKKDVKLGIKIFALIFTNKTGQKGNQK